MTTIMPLIGFWVDGLPKPQGSKRAFVHPHTKRVVMTESAGAPLKDWRHDVKLCAADMMHQTGQSVATQPAAIVLNIDFVLHRPTSMPKTKPTPPAVKKPDLDKLVRGVCDALTGIVYADDSQVVSMHLSKRTAELGEPTGAHIAINTVKAS